MRESQRKRNEGWRVDVKAVGGKEVDARVAAADSLVVACGREEEADVPGERCWGVGLVDWDCCM